MGRSKRNWDALVDYDGNYGVHVQEGIFPGSDGTNIKGTKGQKGRAGTPARKGQKGERGNTGGIGQPGFTGAKGEPGEKGDKLVFADLNLTERDDIKGEKGEIGDTGNPGLKGDQGDASPLLTYRGVVEFNSDFPATGNQIGDVLYSEENGQYWAYDGVRWQSIGNPVKGEEGDKGDKGDRGVKGLSAYELAVIEGSNLTLQQWLDSLKGGTGGAGDKGDKGERGERGFIGLGGQTGDVGAKGEKGEIGETLVQDLILDEYYDKDNVDDLIEGHHPPEYAFHYGYSSQPNNVIDSGDVSFLNRDRNAPIYDPGPVLIKPTANIINFGAPPFEASQEMLIINYPWDDPSNSRSTQYQVVQVVYGLGTGINRFEAYTRRCQPVTNYFSPWQPHTFNEAYYYTKLETELLLRNLDTNDYFLAAENNPTEAFSADLVLRETNRQNGITGDAGRQTIQGQNGIVVYRKDGKLMIDGQALSSGLNYVGPIGIGIDPYAKFPAAVPGDFAIYSDTNTGTAWNGDQVTPGDWVIFDDVSQSPAAWVNLFVGQGAGVVSVDATGLLERQGSQTNPIIHLDENAVVTPDQLDAYPTWATISKIARERRLGSLSDVSVGTDILGYGGLYVTEVQVFSSGKGNYKLDETNQTAQITTNDELNRPLTDFYNAIQVDESFLRVTSVELDWTLTTKVLDKKIIPNGYELQFSDPNIVPLMASATTGWNINIIESNTIEPNATLMWDQFTQKWVAGPQMLSLFLTDARYLRLDTGGTVLGDILCRTSIYADQVLGGQNLEIQDAISAERGTLGTVENPFKGADTNSIVTLGKLFDELAAYTPGDEGSGFLPLTGGTLTGPLNLEKNLYFDTSLSEATFVGIGDETQPFSFAIGSTLATAQTKFIIGRDDHNACGNRILSLGDARFDTDALNRRSADLRYLELTGGTMKGNIAFQECGWVQRSGGATLAYLSDTGNLSAPRVFSERTSNWADKECLSYASLKDAFLTKNNPSFTGSITASSLSAYLTYNDNFSIGRFNNEPNITFQRTSVVLKTALNVNGQEVTGLKDPVNDTDAVTKQWALRNGGGGGDGGATAHDGTESSYERGAIILDSRNVLSIVL